MKKMIQQPYVSIGSDGGSLALTKEFIDQGTHPRAYGTFSRFLGKYVRDEKLMSMEEGIRRMTSLPASRLKIKKRGQLKKGFYADIVLFDAQKIIDQATFENPHQYSIGVQHVFVNGVQVLKEGEHTGALPGKAIRGPGFKKTK
jgi:N-acyl-D-amino-acid deacylase